MAFKIINQTKKTIRLISLLALTLISCAPANTETLKVNLGIPVRSQKPYNFQEKFFTLTQHIQNPFCRQNQVLLVMKDEDSGKILSTQKVKLITEQFNNTTGSAQNSPFSYNTSPGDLDLVIQRLIQKSELEEEPVLIKPINQKVSVNLIGSFFNPINLNQSINKACDAFDFSKKEYYFSRETSFPNFNFSSQSYSGIVGHTATKLSNGKILVIGGISLRADEVIKTVNKVSIFNPDSRTWENVARMNDDRAYHTATLLPDGKIVVIGGIQFNGNGNTSPVSKVEIYDPDADQWNAIEGTSISRYHHSADLIEKGTLKGQILIVGGEGTNGTLKTYQFFNPQTGYQSSANQIHSSISGLSKHTSTALADGNILFFGGYSTVDGIIMISNYYFIFTPPLSSSSPLPISPFSIPVSTNLNGRVNHTATRLSDGRVLFVGGLYSLFSSPSTAPIATDAALYTPETNGSGTWVSITGPNEPRFFHTSTLLPNGTVLISGGQKNETELSNSNEVFNPESNTFEQLDPFTNPLLNLDTVLKNRTATLSGEKVIFIGGNSEGTYNSITNVNPQSTVDMYDSRRTATKATGLFSEAKLDKQSLNSGIVQLKIELLHINPTGVYTSNNTNDNLKNWIQFSNSFSMNSANDNVGSLATLRPWQITMPPPDPNYDSIVFSIDDSQTQGGYTIPQFYPFQLEFRYRSQYENQNSLSNCNDPYIACRGLYLSLIKNSGPQTNLTLFKMPAFSSKGNEPPPSISGSSVNSLTINPLTPNPP